MKRCKRCGVEKEATTINFYKQTRRYDGFHPWCKDCAKEHQKSTQPNRNKRENERWAKDKEYREKRLEIQRRWINKNRAHKREVEKRNRAKNPEPYKKRNKDYQERFKGYLKIQKRATYELQKAINKGILKRPSTCEWCGDKYPIIEAAHHDYDKPLDVKWLCKPCHAKWDYHEPKLIK